MRKTILVGSLGLALCGSAMATGVSLLDGTVNITNNYPDINTVVCAGSGQTTSTVTLCNYTFDFTEDSFTFTNSYGPDNWGTPPAGGWGGFILTFSNVPEITGVTDKGGTLTAPTDLAFNANTIWVEYVDDPRAPGQNRTFGVSFANANAVPEPSTCALLLLAGLAGCRSLRKRAAGAGIKPA